MIVRTHPFLSAAIQLIENDLLIQECKLKNLPRQHRLFLTYSRMKDVKLARSAPGPNLRWVPSGKFKRFVDPFKHDLEDDWLDVQRPDVRSKLVSRFEEFLESYSKAILAEMSEIAVFDMAV